MMGRSWWPGIAASQISKSPSIILSFFLSAVHSNTAAHFVGKKQSHLPEFTLLLPSAAAAQDSDQGNLECQKLFLQSQGAAVNSCNQDKRVWKVLHAPTPSKIHEIRAMKFSV